VLFHIFNAKGIKMAYSFHQHLRPQSFSHCTTFLTPVLTFGIKKA